MNDDAMAPLPGMGAVARDVVAAPEAVEPSMQAAPQGAPAPETPARTVAGDMTKMFYWLAMR